MRFSQIDKKDRPAVYLSVFLTLIVLCQVFVLATLPCWTREEYRDHHVMPYAAQGLVGAERSDRWATERRHFMSKPGNNRCQICGRTKDLNVHHIKSFHLHPELELDHGNMITLDRYCHGKYGHQCQDGRMNWSCENNDLIKNLHRYKAMELKNKSRPD